jgi:2-keto-4-pentenoate hydratase
MISAKDLQESVAAMLAARSDRRALKRLPPSGAALSLEDAYSIQETFVRKHGLPVGLHFVREPAAVIADFGAIGRVQVQVRS